MTILVPLVAWQRTCFEILGEGGWVPATWGLIMLNREKLLLERVDLYSRALLHHEETLAQVFDCCLLVLVYILLVLVMLVGERVELVRPTDVYWIDTLGYITPVLNQSIVLVRVIALLPELTYQLLQILVLHHGCVMGRPLALASHHACHISGCDLGLSIVRDFVVPIVLLLRCP